MRIKKALFWIMTLVLLLSPVIATANGESRMRLSANSLHLEAGQETTVDLLIENAPSIYGVEGHLAFDPDVLEVVDADPNLAGVQLAPGDFIDFDRAFVLQNQADNQAGTLDYALTLLNPAPPVQGDGLLARITFRARVDGPATIRIVSGLFGTQTGEVISPIIENAEVRSAPEATAERDSPAEEQPAFPVERAAVPSAGETSADGASFPVDLAVLGLGVALALIGIISFVASRFRRNTA
jgi:hypothetical protein